MQVGKKFLRSNALGRFFLRIHTALNCFLYNNFLGQCIFRVRFLHKKFALLKQLSFPCNQSFVGKPSLKAGLLIVISCFLLSACDQPASTEHTHTDDHDHSETGHTHEHEPATEAFYGEDAQTLDSHSSQSAFETQDKTQTGSSASQEEHDHAHDDDHEH